MSEPAEDQHSTTLTDRITEALGIPPRRLLLEWEKGRILYNAVLVGFVLYFAFPALAHSPFWLFLIQGAVIANLCFFAGPLAEAYLRYLGLRHPLVRAALLVGGTLLALFLTFWAILIFIWEPMP